MSLRKRAESAFAASGAEGGIESLAADERSRVESVARSRINRWCHRMGVSEAPDKISLERRSSSDSGPTAGWFRFTVEDLEFWARADSDGRFDVFLTGSSSHEAPIESLVDLGRALAGRNANSS